MSAPGTINGNAVPAARFLALPVVARQAGPVSPLPRQDDTGTGTAPGREDGDTAPLAEERPRPWRLPRWRAPEGDKAITQAMTAVVSAVTRHGRPPGRQPGQRHDEKNADYDRQAGNSAFPGSGEGVGRDGRRGN